jgi:hypothetical protein
MLGEKNKKKVFSPGIEFRVQSSGGTWRVSRQFSNGNTGHYKWDLTISGMGTILPKEKHGEFYTDPSKTARQKHCPDTSNSTSHGYDKSNTSFKGVLYGTRSHIGRVIRIRMNIVSWKGLTDAGSHLVFGR